MAVAHATKAGEELPKIAERWAQGEELPFDRDFQKRLKVDNYVQAQLRGLELDLRTLRDFSRQALAANRPLLLWMCL